MKERLQKIIAAAGFASRRQAEAMILAGQVGLNGKVIKKLGEKADPQTDKITVNGIALPKNHIVISYILNKPPGVVCSRHAQNKEKLITDLVPNTPPVYPVGRLDKDSQGLILLTNNGNLAYQLTHPKYHLNKTYLVVCRPEGIANPEKIVKTLLKGVKLGDGLARADSVKITLNELPAKLHLEIAVHEGRNHLVRRMCAAVSLKVESLTRISLGNLKIGNLKPGHFRPLLTSEIEALLTSCK